MKVSRWLRVLLWALSAGIWIFSAGFDGRFLAGLMPPGIGGAVLGYGLNFVADVSNEMFAYVFALLQRTSRKGSKVWRWSFALLVGEIVALYFGTVFSWSAIADAAPDLAPWLQWSAALFAQATLLFLGVAQALLDVKPKADTSESGPNATETVIALPFACRYCNRTFASQNALNSHIGRCKAKPNGHSEPEPLEERPIAN